MKCPHCKEQILTYKEACDKWGVNKPPVLSGEKRIKMILDNNPKLTYYCCPNCETILKIREEK